MNVIFISPQSSDRIAALCVNSAGTGPGFCCRWSPSTSNILRGHPNKRAKFDFQVNRSLQIILLSDVSLSNFFLGTQVAFARKLFFKHKYTKNIATDFISM